MLINMDTSNLVFGQRSVGTQQAAPKSVGVTLSNFMDDIKKRAMTNANKKRTIDEIATNLNSKEVSAKIIYSQIFLRVIWK